MACSVLRVFAASALSEVVVRRGGGRRNPQVFPLRRVPQSDPGYGNVYEAGGFKMHFKALIREREPRNDRWAVDVLEERASCKEGSTPWRSGVMVRAGLGNCWALKLPAAPSASAEDDIEVDFGSNDLLALAADDAHLPFQEDPRLDPAGPRGMGSWAPEVSQGVQEQFPFWSKETCQELANFGAKGRAAVVFDAETFMEMVYLSAFPAPVLFPHAAYKLQARLGLLTSRVSELLECGGRRGQEGSPCAHALLDGVDEIGLLSLSGGRLVGLMDGALCQVGDDLLDGLDQVTAKPETVTFEGPPIGIGLGPADTESETGAQVTEVDPETAADMAGVSPGWTLSSINGLDVRKMPFWEVDARFDEPPPWEVIFEPSIDASNLYAVELPAFELMAEAAEAAGLGEVEEGDVEVGKEMQEGSRGVLPFLWQEEFARLFLGDPGSMTCLHVDLIPQVEFCHMLVGAKVLGAFSWSDTPRVLKKYGGSAGPAAGRRGVEAEASPLSVPSDQPLLPEEEELLSDPSASLVLGRPGDAVVFSSAAAHFATNGSASPSAALYHGAVTPASVPRLCFDAIARGSPFTAAERAADYSQHLTAKQIALELPDLPSLRGLFRATGGFHASGGFRPRQGEDPKSPPPAGRYGGGSPSAADERYLECLEAMESALSSARRGEAPPQWAGEDSVAPWWCGRAPLCGRQ